jgi:phosphate transport system substrate-binding protein
MAFTRVKHVEFGSATRLLIAATMVVTSLSAGLGCIKPAGTTDPVAKTSTTAVTTASTETSKNAAVANAETAKSNEPVRTAQPGKAAETVNIEGSSTVYLIAQAWAVEFEKTGNYKVSLNRNGTGGGYKSFALRRCDLWNASRPIATEEKAELRDKRIDWLELEVAIDGISIAVNPKNDWCTELTVGDLRKLWKPDSTIAKWSDLNPQWPDQKIELFGADVDSGTFEYFTEVIVGKKKSSRTNYRAASDDNVLIQGVSRSKYGLGYIPFGYCVENSDKVKLVKVSPTIEASESPVPAIEPTVETILSGEYRPLSRPLYVYVNKDSLKRFEVVAYLKFAISLAAQPLVRERGLVRIPEEKRQEMEARLESALHPPTKAVDEKPAAAAAANQPDGETKSTEAESPK